MASGIEWFPLETDLLTDDEKVFDLMDGSLDECAFADFGRFIALLNRIYREGPALQVNRRMARRIAHDLGLGAEGFEDFIGRCVSAGLFSARMWREERVLTSRGIQLRWVKAKGRAKSQGLPAETRQWSLLDGSEEDCDDLCEFADVDEVDERGERDTGDGSALEKLTNSESSPLDKTRREEIRKEEKREDQSTSSSQVGSEVFDTPRPSQDAELDLASLVPPCLARERDGALFDDGQGADHRTPYGALMARYEARTGRRDFAECMAKVHGMCPAGCRASPRDVSECYALITDAVERSDPSKGSPWALIRHVLEHDRGSRHA